MSFDMFSLFSSGHIFICLSVASADHSIIFKFGFYSFSQIVAKNSILRITSGQHIINNKVFLCLSFLENGWLWMLGDSGLNGFTCVSV
uniref:Uncharacterized protein n=1 Tax=Rhizophora mucronata TaxID=61149 RepID=A0A2P2QF68_RHIMU